MMKIPRYLLTLCLFPLLGLAEEEPKEARDFFTEGETLEFREDTFTVTLRYLGYPDTRAARVAVESFELESVQDFFWVSEEARFVPSQMVNLIGQGFAAGPLRIKVDDEKQLGQWQSVLAEAVAIYNRIPEIRAELVEQHGQIPATLQVVTIHLGEVYSYPKKKPMQVRFEANFGLREYNLLIGETIRLTDYSLEAVEFLLSNVERYLQAEEAMRAERDTMLASLKDRLRGN